MVHIDYVSVENLKSVISGGNLKSPNGVFQQFIDPMGNFNAIIEWIWSPNITIFEKRVNKKNLYDKRFDLFERAVTFDGDEIYSNIEYIKGTGLSQKIRRTLDDIINVPQKN